MLKFAILGTGGMAHAHAHTLKNNKDAEITAACEVNAERLETFCKTHDIPNGYTKLEEMLEAGGFDAVINVTPDGFHHPLSLKVIEAGYHILCEKPLAVNYADAKEMQEAAEKAGVVNMVNLSYRCGSNLQKAREVIASGEIGEIRHFEAHYYQSWLPSKVWGDWKTNEGWLWRLSSAHGSKGVLGDVGVHIIDYATFPMDESITELYCQMKCFEKERIGDYLMDVNDTAILTATLSGGATGTIQTTRWASGEGNNLRLRIYGTKGGLKIDNIERPQHIQLCVGDNLDRAAWDEIYCPPTPNNHERFIRSIQEGVQEQPDFARGAEIQRVMDACFVSAEQKGPVSLAEEACLSS